MPWVDPSTGEVTGDVCPSTGHCGDRTDVLHYLVGRKRSPARCERRGRGTNRTEQLMQDETSTPYGYCKCGCGGKTTVAQQNHTKRGWVKGEPIRFVPGHANRLPATPYEERDCGYDTDCWVWTRYVAINGYAYMPSKDRVPRLAHRVFYERSNGPIPAGLDLDHLCRNRACVNPDHLEPVTRKENLRRGANGPLLKTHCPQGHPYSGDNLYISKKGYRRCWECRRRTWRESYHRSKGRPS